MTDHSKYRATLEARARELGQTLRKRERIAIEVAAEEAELVSLASQRDLAVRDLDRNAQALREVRAALARLAGGEFGRCQECERAIPAKRLDALPWARYCVPCQEALDRERDGASDSIRFAA
jgi:DnaK suppressor protein